MIEAILLGVGVGVVSVTTGLGGGIILVPLLPLIFPYTQIEAIATSLLVVFINSFQLVLISNKNKLIDIKSSIRLAIAGVVLSSVVSWNVYYFSEEFLKVLLFAALFLAILLLLRPIKYKFKNDDFLSYTIGGLGGAISGFTGLGGGIIVGPLAYGFSLVLVKNMAPTISFVTMSFALTAVLSHIIKAISAGGFWGPIHWQTAILIFIPAFITSRLLFNVQKKIPDHIRKIFLISICALLLIKSFFAIFH